MYKMEYSSKRPYSTTVPPTKQTDIQKLREQMKKEYKRKYLT